jgi:small-conductance mechanosensitive channel
MDQLWQRLRAHLTEDAWQWALPLFVGGAVLAVGYVLKRIAVATTGRLLHRHHRRMSEEALHAISGTLTFWLLLLATYLAVQSAEFTLRAKELTAQALLILFVASLTFAAARMAGRLITIYGAQLPGALAVTSLTQNLVRGLVLVVGALIVLNLLGVSITPMLTALGVGGLAVALALQDTLSNLFAGFYVGLAGQIRIGDYIKLNSGEEGFVRDIGWRATTLAMLANNMIIIPNGKLAQAIVTNYDLPEKRMSLLIPIGVSYESDPAHVERVLTETAMHAAGAIPGLLAEPAPFVRFIPGFGDSSLNFTLICQVAQFTDQYLVQHELRKRILQRFREERIEIPYPTRTLHLRDLPATGARGD